MPEGREAARSSLYLKDTRSDRSNLATPQPDKDSAATMSQQPEKTAAPEALIDDSNPHTTEQQHEEFVKPVGDVDLPITSAYAGWSRNATIKRFWRLYITGILVAIAAM